MAAHHHQELLEAKSARESNNINIMVSSSSSAFVYSDVSTHNPHNNLHNFDPSSEVYHLTSGLEMIGFQPKPLVSDPGPSTGLAFFHDHRGGGGGDHNLMGAVEQGRRASDDHHQVGGFMDESSLRTCVFSCEGNERPSQGLSLSLSSSNPSSIGLQSFELRHHHHHHHNNTRYDDHHNLGSSSSSRDDHGFMMMRSKSQSFQPQQESFLGRSATVDASMSLQYELMRSSKYMGPAQELLKEFCNLGTHQISDEIKQSMKKKKSKDHNWDFLHATTSSDDQNNDNNGASCGSSRNDINPSLCGLSIMDLHKRKTKLLGMLEQLDRRYKHYCEQMKGVVSSFESVAGASSADSYTTLASKAMSRHFRCLRDSIVAQIKATKNAMGEKDPSSASTVPATTRGETPRLRILDQTLRHQRALQQMTMMESHPWRPQRGLPDRAVSVLRAWLFEHFLHPYPSDVDKHILARQTGLSRSQVSNWFINARVRLWKPMVEQMYVEETKEDQQDKTNNLGSSSDNATDHNDHEPLHQDHDGLTQDQKPDPGELIRLDPDSLSSIIHTTHATSTSKTLLNASANNTLQQSQPFGRVEAFGAVDMPHFPSSSSYNHTHPAAYGGATQNDENAPHQGFGGGGNNNNVSLTLGLQQHGGKGVSLTFAPSSQASLFYGRDHIDECQPVQYSSSSLLDGDQAQNLPYRNLMGAQLLHDFA